jgi:K+-sensing histidine kinase KdpD
MNIGLKSFIGITICPSVALFLSIFLNDGGEVRLAAPVLCLLALIFAVCYCGRLSGFIGSVVAGIMLALLLFPPFGTLNVQEPAARVMLTLSQLGAIAVVISSPGNPTSRLTLRDQLRRAGSNFAVFEFLKSKNSK